MSHPPEGKKASLISQIRQHFEEEIRELESAGHGPQSTELQEKRRALLMFRFLPSRDAEPSEVIAPGSLVEVETAGRKSWVLIVPQHGGLILKFEGLPVQVLTPQSPLGEALLGKKSGQTAELTTHTGSSRSYKIGVSL